MLIIMIVKCAHGCCCVVSLSFWRHEMLLPNKCSPSLTHRCCGKAGREPAVARARSWETISFIAKTCLGWGLCWKLINPICLGLMDAPLVFACFGPRLQSSQFQWTAGQPDLTIVFISEASKPQATPAVLCFLFQFQFSLFWRHGHSCLRLSAHECLGVPEAGAMSFSWLAVTEPQVTNMTPAVGLVQATLSSTDDPFRLDFFGSQECAVSACVKMDYKRQFLACLFKHVLTLWLIWWFNLQEEE